MNLSPWPHGRLYSLCSRSIAPPSFLSVLFRISHIYISFLTLLLNSTFTAVKCTYEVYDDRSRGRRHNNNPKNQFFSCSVGGARVLTSADLLDADGLYIHVSACYDGFTPSSLSPPSDEKTYLWKIRVGSYEERGEQRDHVITWPQ